MADAILSQGSIYAIRNIKTSKMYVGQSINVTRRLADHFKLLRAGRHHCIALQRAFVKYGAEAFRAEILEKCMAADLTEREQFWMDCGKLADGIYNMAPAAGSPRGIKRSPETLLKSSLARRGAKMSEEAKRAMSAAQSTPEMRELHRKHGLSQSERLTSPENRAKLLAANLGSKRSPESRARISASLVGREVSAETRVRLSVSHLGNAHSAATKERMRAIHLSLRESSSKKAVEQMARPGMRELLASRKRGSKASEATKKKLSEISRARWADPDARALMLAKQLQGKLAKSASK